MDYAAQVQMTVRSLKGPALSVLVLMLWSRQWHSPVWDVKELITGTGYDNESIAKARSTLIGLRLAEPANAGRYGLRLVDRAVQQLGFLDALPPIGDLIEGAPAASSVSPVTRSENPISCASSSGSSSYIEAESASRRQLPLQPAARSEKPISLEREAAKAPKHPAMPTLARWFVDVIGCPSYRIASEAVTAALDDGMEPIEIKYEALWWWVYCANGSVTSIPREHWGFFIARKVQQSEFVYEGYTYSERIVKGVNADVFNEFLEVKFVCESKTEGG